MNGPTGGWHGRALEVDLSSGRFEEKSIPEEDLAGFLGGRGLGVLEISRRLAPGTDPLSPENLLVLTAGPLTGTPVPSSGRFSLVSRSPLTGTIFDSSCGGSFGMGLKGSGFDMLVVTGRSSSPVYLVISPEGVKFQDASSLWGMDTLESQQAIIGQEDKPRGILTIGPAGENLIPLAGIRSSGRSLGRGGLGAVMGSKNLKGIAIDGRISTEIAYPDRLEFVIHEMDKWIKAHPMTSLGLPRFGTAVLVKIINRLGMFPVRNFTGSMMDDPDSISGETLADTRLVRRSACRGCSIGCGRISRVADQEGEGPEYETIWALGPECGIFDLEWITRANFLCNSLGLDTISTGVTIGCAMEMEEKGFLDWGLAFGRSEGLLEIIGEMARGEGRGGELSVGSRRFACSRGAGELAMQAKGLELPAYDPRGAQGQALGFATSNRGACHLRSYMIAPEVLGIPKMVDRGRPEGKAGMTIVQQNANAAMDSLALCRFLNFALSDEYYARALSAVTGRRYETQDLLAAGEKIWTLERLFNLKEGFTAADDTLPGRFLKEPVESGPSSGRVVELEPMLEEYYRFRGYDQDGVPSEDKLKTLGLEEYHAPGIRHDRP
jgi:aldehyde:ferredoxin oxidoreductase